MAKYLGLVGYPIEHSISPLFQQAALDFYGLDIKYEAWSTPPERLYSAAVRLRHPSTLGANITVPHKEAILPFMDEMAPAAEAIGAVNTVVNRGSRLVGDNTDAQGFLQALRTEAHFEPQGQRVVLLGAGGAARAILYSLIQVGAHSVTILNRTYERAQSLASAFPASKTEIVVMLWETATLAARLRDCTLIVNATSLGMKHSPAEGQSPLPAEAIPSRALVYDLVYNPAETPLLCEAKKAGARTLGGLAMLVYQGAASFELWTGRKAPLEVMFTAARRALGV